MLFQRLEEIFGLPIDALWPFLRRPPENGRPLCRAGSIGGPVLSEVLEVGSGKLILPIEEPGSEAAIAAPDFMNAARCAVIVATGEACAPTMKRALGSASPSCPASLLRPSRMTWLLDAESAASV
eukprot:symbB.v1.2.004402.t1/scaffold247.1/size253962/2